MNQNFDQDMVDRLARAIDRLEECDDIGARLSKAGCVGPRGLSEQNPMARYLQRKLKRTCQVRQVSGPWFVWVWSEPPNRYVLAAAQLPQDCAEFCLEFEAGMHEHLATPTPLVHCPWGVPLAVHKLADGAWWVRAEGDCGIVAVHPEAMQLFSLACLAAARATGVWYAWGEGRWPIPALEMPAGSAEQILKVAEVHGDALIHPQRSLATIANASTPARAYMKATNSKHLFSPGAIVTYRQVNAGTVVVGTAGGVAYEVSLTSIKAFMRGGDWPIPIDRLEVIREPDLEPPGHGGSLPLA